MKKRLLIGLFALTLVAAACGGDDTADTTAAPNTTASATAAVSITSGSVGDYLVDAAGNTLYLFVPDAQGPSTCNDGCATAWPPLTIEVSAGSDVDASLLGTAARDDGSSQATYNGWPLYYFASDGAAGDAKGQGVNEVWFVLDAAGNAISASQ